MLDALVLSNVMRKTMIAIQTARRLSNIPYLAALIAMALIAAPTGRADAQTAAALKPDIALREATTYLRVVRTLMSQCENASWVLWYSNSYQDWRSRKTPVFSMNLSLQTFDRLPPIPALFAA